MIIMGLLKRLGSGITNGLDWKSALFGPRGFPIFLCYTMLAVLLVLFRMKNVEMDYQLVKAKKDLEKLNNDSKELNALKARLLSTEKLRKLADVHHLEQPTQKQIIVIP